MIHTELAGVPDHDVNELLCQFIAEVRKDGGTLQKLGCLI